MRINDITTTNLHIMQGIAQDYSKLPSLPSKIDSILSRVVIRYDLDLVNPFELLGLQKVGSVTNISHMDIQKDDLNLFLEETRYSVENTSDEVLLQKTVAMNAYMANKNGRNEYRSVRKIGPIGLQVYKCIITLRGSSILNLYGYNFSQIFEIPESEDVGLESYIQAMLVRALINATYKNLQNLLTTKDIYTDAWYFDNFYKGRNKEYTLMSIFDNVGNTITFVDTTTEELKSYIALAKKANDNHSDREWTIEIVCDTPIYMYFFYLSTVSGVNDKFNIVNVEDMMIILSEKRRLSKLTDNELITDGIESSILSYSQWFDHNMENEKFDLFSRFLFAPANSNIRYTIQLKWHPDIVDDYFAIFTDLFKKDNLKELCPNEYTFLCILNQVSNLIKTEFE